MKSQVLILPAARQDMLEQAVFYEARAGAKIGDEFLRECELAITRIAEFPAMGARFRRRSAALRGCRYLTVPSFEMSLIFYRVLKGRIEVMRVVHGARDLDAR